MDEGRDAEDGVRVTFRQAQRDIYSVRNEFTGLLIAALMA
jgi:hypothetical protein